MACNLSQYCAGNIAAAKKFYQDIYRGNIFTGTIAATKLFASVNTETIAPAKSITSSCGSAKKQRYQIIACTS